MTNRNEGEGGLRHYEISYQPRAWEGLEDEPLQPVVFNICLWHDGTLHPRIGHTGQCRWLYEGQVFYHTKPLNK